MLWGIFIVRPQPVDQVRVKVVDSEPELQEALAIRREVFIIEQSVPEEIEMDSHDSTSTHVLARLEGQPVGTARWRRTESGTKLERFAVPRSYRGKGIGKALLEFILDRVSGEGPVYLHAQTPVIPFYEKYGFACVGEPFFEAGISHRKMIYQEYRRGRNPSG